MESNILKGGEFLLRDSDYKSNFIPEDLSEEQRMMGDAVRDFVESEVVPNGFKLENQVALLELAAKLGMLGLHIPERYGGSPADQYSICRVLEELGKGDASFNTSFAAHTGIGMLPIFYFGTEAIRQAYLPGMCNGSIKASYCLTEPGSGSDALAAKSHAVLSADGDHYLLNGQKIWITNAGFADLFIVFAQVDGSQFTGFLVNGNAEGISLGEEEHKLGIKGSSTRQVFFDNVRVPVEHVLGKVGFGHLIAFNVLNIGRYKLGVLTMGGAKKVLSQAVAYANQRVQFGKPISTYGAIRHKLAESAVRIFAAESAAYRIADLLEDRQRAVLSEGKDESAAMLEAAREYAVECAILKVAGSELIDYVVDEAVQIHGGNGFSEEYPLARAYRDARINRIYEGTNEINRLLIFNMLLKKALGGELDLTGPAWEVQKELTGLPVNTLPDGPYALESRTVSEFRKLVLLVAGAAVKYQLDGKHDLREQQEILLNLSDMTIDLFQAESVLMRVKKICELKDDVKKGDVENLMKVFFWSAQQRMIVHAQDALCSFSSGDELRILLLGIRRVTRYEPINPRQLRDDIAGRLVQANGYCF
jgi:alkylation response protein AidB-like acyl-CoA dehydrogenase